MKLKVNGETKVIDEGLTLADALEQLGIRSDARGVAVAVNDTVIPQPNWHQRSLSDGDAVEIIHAVQGG